MGYHLEYEREQNHPGGEFPLDQVRKAVAQVLGYRGEFKRPSCIQFVFEEDFGKADTDLVSIYWQDGHLYTDEARNDRAMQVVLGAALYLDASLRGEEGELYEADGQILDLKEQKRRSSIFWHIFRI